MAKIVIACLIICWGFFNPGLTKAADTSERVRKIGKTVFEMQQSFLELKEEFDKKDKAWKSQQEEFQLLVGKLRKENEALLKQITALRNQTQEFDEKLEASSTTKLSNDFNDLDSLIKSMILDSLEENSQAEKLILATINRPASTFHKDLLIFYLATKKRQQGELEESLGYFSTLISQFPDSPYFSRSIFEMSEVFGSLGMKSEQNTLLLQLSLVDEHDIYAVRAKEKLKEIEALAENLLKKEGSATDSTTDLSSNTTTKEPVSKSGIGQTNAAQGSSQEVTVPEIAESSSDMGQNSSPEETISVEKKSPEDTARTPASAKVAPVKKADATKIPVSAEVAPVKEEDDTRTPASAEVAPVKEEDDTRTPASAEVAPQKEEDTARAPVSAEVAPVKEEDDTRTSASAEVAPQRKEDVLRISVSAEEAPEKGDGAEIEPRETTLDADGLEKEKKPENVTQGSSPDVVIPAKEVTNEEAQQESTPKQPVLDKADSLESDQPESRADQPLPEKEETAAKDSQGSSSEDSSFKPAEGKPN